ncbi:MAG TPA: helix-turn-helix transcriptional regulator [Herpetosiphonaceae bacterium]
MTFGQILSEARKRLDISQKDLAAKVQKEDGEAISPQYLNDIERDRRNPPSDHLIEQFARILDIDVDILYFRAGRLPADIRAMNVEEDKIRAAYIVFRQKIKG